MRNGEDVRLPNGRHTFLNVYKEMFIQVMLDYPSLGDFRKLTYDEILFFYEGIRPSLRKATKT